MHKYTIANNWYWSLGSMLNVHHGIHKLDDKNIYKCSHYKRKCNVVLILNMSKWILARGISENLLTMQPLKFQFIFLALVLLLCKYSVWQY